MGSARLDKQALQVQPSPSPHGNSTFDAASGIEKASSEPSIREGWQEKLADTDVHEIQDPEECVAAAPSRLHSSDQGRYLVQWHGDADSDHPQNWTGRRKWTAMFLGRSLISTYSTID